MKLKTYWNVEDEKLDKLTKSSEFCFNFKFIFKHNESLLWFKISLNNKSRIQNANELHSHSESFNPMLHELTIYLNDFSGEF